MTIAVADIIRDVRYITGDDASNRYSDGVLRNYLNYTLRQIALQTDYFDESRYVALGEGHRIYDVSNLFWAIKRIEFKGVPLKLQSFDDLDDQDPGWRDRTAEEPTTVILGLSSPGAFRLYPALSGVQDTYHIEDPNPFGLITDFSHTDFRTDFTMQPQTDPITGLITDMDEVGKWIRVYGTRVYEVDEAGSDDTINIPKTFLIVLRLGILSQAYLSGNDQVNYRRADKAQMDFNRELVRIIADGASNFSKRQAENRTHFNGYGLGLPPRNVRSDGYFGHRNSVFSSR